MSTATIKPSHKAILAYYDQLKAYDAQQVGHETALRSAFLNLLAETAKAHKWTLVPEQSLKVRGKLVRPDGTLRDDEWRLPRGYWEAKDSDDVLDAEIRKKINKGYPLVNTIFEDTRHGVLFQNGTEIDRDGPHAHGVEGKHHKIKLSSMPSRTRDRTRQVIHSTRQFRDLTGGHAP